MIARPVAALAPLSLVLATATPAFAGHSHCSWGAHLAIDPTRPEPVHHRVGAPTWGCSGPVVQAYAGAAGYGIGVRVTAGGVDWWTVEPSRPASEPDPAAQDSTRTETQGESLRLVVRPRTVVAGRRVRFRARVVRRDATGALPAGDYAIRLSGRSARTGADGRARLTARLRRTGVVRVVALDGRRRVATAFVRVQPRR